MNEHPLNYVAGFRLMSHVTVYREAMPDSVYGANNPIEDEGPFEVPDSITIPAGTLYYELEVRGDVDDEFEVEVHGFILPAGKNPEWLNWIDTWEIWDKCQEHAREITDEDEISESERKIIGLNYDGEIEHWTSI